MTTRPSPARPSFGVWALCCALACLAYCAPASACKVAPDARTLSERLDASKEAWVGRVTGLGADWVEFEVVASVKGVAKIGATERRPAFVDGSCSLVLGRGQLWLYAGSSQETPSMVLGQPGWPPVEPAHKALPSKEERPFMAGCSEADRCVALAHGCGEVGWIPASKLSAAGKALFAPATAECKPPARPAASFGMCDRGSCVGYEVPNTSPPKP